MKFDLVASRKWLYIVSGALFVLSLVMLAIPPALRLGIEFTAGSTTQIRFQRAISEQQIREAYESLGHPEARIQSITSTEFLITTRELHVPPGSFTTPASEDGEPKPVGPQQATTIGSLTLGGKGATGKIGVRAPAADDACALEAVTGELDAGAKLDVIGTKSCPDGTVYRVMSGTTVGWVKAADTQGYTPAGAPQDQGERTVIENGLRERLGDFEVREFATVSATVSGTTVRNAAIAVGVASLFILIYIALAFAAVPSPIRYGTCAVVAMAHDVVVTLGFFSLLGKVFGVEVNLMFVTGLLTVIGFSVHDTIVIFDRIRENIRQAPNASLHENVNAAILQTIARSLNTSLTVLITVAAMLVLGGATIQSFLLVILIGVTAGTYSSIGIAAQLLVSWETGELARLAFWRKAPSTAESAG